jgi:hypothetical protein
MGVAYIKGTGISGRNAEQTGQNYTDFVPYILEFSSFALLVKKPPIKTKPLAVTLRSIFPFSKAGN